MNLKGVLNGEEQTQLVELITDQRGTFRLLVKIVDRLVQDRADALLKETDHAKLSARKSELEGAQKIQIALANFIEKAGRQP